MKYFFFRYHTLEKSNFPIATRENVVCLILLSLSFMVHSLNILSSQWCLLNISAPIWVGGIAIFVSLFTTFIATAPVIGRIMPIHRWYLWLVHYPLFRVMESIVWCTGTNKHGYIMHLTAPKLLGYEYVSPEQMDRICSLAIVRNPYSRMVSIYGYNRFGPMEDFPSFVRRWKTLMKHYIERNEMEEWYTPCHLLPQFEFTHYKGKQLVQSVVKQEELKFLKTTQGAEQAIKVDNSVSDLPDIVRNALLGMPHTNKRATSKKWYDYYDQETLELTYEMYYLDFEVFGYETHIAGRPDLVALKKDRRDMLQAMKFDKFSRDSFIQDGVRMSKANLFSSVHTSVKRDDARKSRSGSMLKQSVLGVQKTELMRAVTEISREDSSDASGGESFASKKGNWFHPEWS